MDNGHGAERRTLLPAIVCTVAIAALSLWPKPPPPPESLAFPHADKVAHVLMYAVYVGLLGWTFRSHRRNWRIGVGLAAYGMAFGALMEVLQASVPALERTLSLGDMLANGIGSAVGLVACLFVAKAD